MANLGLVLDKQHLDVLDRAVQNVLDTDLALETCAQIIDGLPLASVAYDQYKCHRDEEHPISYHTSLCHGAEKAARGFLYGFTISMLDFDNKLLHAYQSAPLGHRSFYYRLIELVAVAVHKMASLLFNQGHRMHDREAQNVAFSIDLVSSWQSEEERELKLPHPGPTMFKHLSYDARDQYPEGVADVVGYWAENRILGGVVVFDRSEVWDDEHNPEPNIYLHSDRDGVTIRICQMLDEQEQALADFLLCSPVTACPLPLSASHKNLTRFDPDQATENGVYRDIWERKPPKLIKGRGGRGVGGCCPDPLDYPSLFFHLPH